VNALEGERYFTKTQLKANVAHNVAQNPDAQIIKIIRADLSGTKVSIRMAGNRGIFANFAGNKPDTI